MALICPVCSMENREGANFCKSCGGKLAPAAPMPISPSPAPRSRSEREWAATAPAQLRAPTIPGGLFEAGMPAASVASSAGAATLADEKTLIAALGRLRRPPSPPREPRARKSSKPRTPRPPRAEPRKPWRSRGFWLWLLLLAAGLVMVAAGWRGYGADQPDEEVEIAKPAAPAVPPAPSIELPAAVPEPAPAEPPAAETLPHDAAATTAPAANLKPAPAAVSKSRKPAPAATSQAGAPESVPAATAAAPTPSQAPSAPTDPLAICGDRNFIAKAQCMAAQCLKPEYKPHAQCEAVRRQQRIEEEKRNPTLVN
ncbi:hypothetical protein [Variovorax paradoxus]|uniref:hypothetical protein n=1 Tax=Variovorax paradoxus TaxID=34073 RepID=UPI003D65931A